MTKANFNWFPGHMNKSIKEIEEKIKIVDLVMEIVDARAPFSTQNPLFRKILSKRPKLIILSKGDLADDEVTTLWQDYFKTNKDQTILVKDKNVDIYKEVLKSINFMTQEKQLKDKKKGIENSQINVLVVGIPNVGKSSIISRLVKGKHLKIGNKPGVTRGMQRISMTNNITLIDTPGILPAKFENETIACNCAATNSIRIDVVPKERFATKLMQYIYNTYPSLIENIYDINKKVLRPINYEDTFKLFEEIAKRKKYVILEDMIDIEKAIQLFINDLIQNKFGKISFEKPIEVDQTSKASVDDRDLDTLVESDLTVEW
ncbi:ribosomal biogenesis GTPase [Spiroplasma helicoides]|uniref:Ribosome biogenesis GTPase A n=1 Tax=Spiroplasma helicoides TaxID=216938 RepID=A0A1B3SJX4_9MOLU|nr:ribosome biogenesis GTPase YlqF [Spiroplasma helicoides]AOG60234.1 ribosomal biogenesis GTPase [Spiroplasma helicoides]